MADCHTNTEAADAMFARYGAAMPDFGHWNATLATLMSHRSVRAFTDQPIPEGVVETLVAAAQSAATSSNMQTWSVIAVTDPAMRAKFAAWANHQPHVTQSPLVLVWLADLSRSERIGAARGREMVTLPYTEMAMVAMIDAALAAQNATVAAESLGLGSCYLGALRNKPQEVAEALGLPAQCFPVFGLSIGWPDPARPSEIRPRLPQSVVLHHERYDISQEAAGIALYDERFTAYQRQVGLPPSGWVARMIERMGVIGGMNGREIMRGALAALGFPLG